MRSKKKKKFLWTHTQCNVCAWIEIILFLVFSILQKWSINANFWLLVFEYVTGHTFPIIYLLTLKVKKNKICLHVHLFVYGNSNGLWNRISKRNCWLFCFDKLSIFEFNLFDCSIEKFIEIFLSILLQKENI